MRRQVAGIVASLVVLLAVDSAAVLLHDEQTPYDAQQAVRDFRKQAAATPQPAGSPSSAAVAATPTNGGTPWPSLGPAAAGAPAQRSAAPAATPPSGAPTPAARGGEVAPGVYRYATSGSERVDALGGARHDYPAETTVSYRRAGCGTEDRWQPLKERFSVNTLCRGPKGLEARGSVQHREFFGQSEEQVLVCAPGLVLVPDDPRPGRTSSSSCRSDDTTVALTARVVDVKTMKVGGRMVEAVHLRVDGTISGSTRGSTQREEWFTRAGLLVRATASTESDRDTSGGVVHYSETYGLSLESLEPER